MAHAFIKPEVITSTALGILEQELIMSSLVWTNPGFDFAGAKDDTLTIRLPGKTTANTFPWRSDRTTDTVQLNDITEDTTTVTLDTDIYSAVALTDEELSLDISDFGSQVLRPQVRAVAEYIDASVQGMITGATYATTVAVAPATGASDDEEAKAIYNGIVEMRTALNSENVPASGRTLLMGSGVEAALLKGGFLRDASQADSDSALREATVGRLLGFDIVVSNLLPANEMYGFVRSAFVLCTRAPAVPSGATFAASQSANGLSMRWIRDYDPMKLRDRSVVSLFSGLNVVQDVSVTNTPGDLTKSLVRAVKGTYTPAPLA
ncbi:hypothetical protein LHJ74_30690 [Streptomyces sp. N2-109]|uniref:Uncharacterized protein n=1 Tax=Streptomyces gossypii TaxID=2883101 RepID=A0ABT2K234_9ACTN|nr:P22 phage major capsid protein family protein [Streptomyces gossypii]MCT2594224.1 hypothetical protein [Streptomyces gossypii]